MVHVSGTCNPNFHATCSHYINADTTASCSSWKGTCSRTSPTCVSSSRTAAAQFLSLGRYRAWPHAEAAAPARACDEERLLRHLRLSPRASTCCSRSSTTRTSVWLGDGRRRARHRPGNGQFFDDTKRYIDRCRSPDEKSWPCSKRTPAVYPRLDKQLKERGCKKALLPGSRQ